MKARSQISKETSQSAAQQVQPSLRSRPFAPPLKPEAEQAPPDLQTQLENAQRFGHHFGQYKISARSSALPPIQPKLTIGAPGDKYEREADRVAKQVVQQLNAPLKKQSDKNVQREPSPEGEEAIQTKPRYDRIQGGTKTAQEAELEKQPDVLPRGSLHEREGEEKKDKQEKVKQVVDENEKDDWVGGSARAKMLRENKIAINEDQEARGNPRCVFPLNMVQDKIQRVININGDTNVTKETAEHELGVIYKKINGAWKLPVSWSEKIIRLVNDKTIKDFKNYEALGAHLTEVCGPIAINTENSKNSAKPETPSRNKRKERNQYNKKVRSELAKNNENTNNQEVNENTESNKGNKGRDEGKSHNYARAFEDSSSELEWKKETETGLYLLFDNKVIRAGTQKHAEEVLLDRLVKQEHVLKREKAYWQNALPKIKVNKTMEISMNAYPCMTGGPHNCHERFKKFSSSHEITVVVNLTGDTSGFSRDHAKETPEAINAKQIKYQGGQCEYVK
jgi:hypothetical protein